MKGVVATGLLLGASFAALSFYCQRLGLTLAAALNLAFSLAMFVFAGLFWWALHRAPRVVAPQEGEA